VTRAGAAPPELIRHTANDEGGAERAAGPE
jgi:hypothetical protein